MSQGKKKSPEQKQEKTKPVSSKAEKAFEGVEAEDVLKALGMSPAEALRRMEAHKQSAELVNYDLGPVSFPLKVNGQPVPRRGRATKAQLELYQEALGKARMRRIREMFSNEHLIRDGIMGGFQATVVQTTDQYGNVSIPSQVGHGRTLTPAERSKNA